MKDYGPGDECTWPPFCGHPNDPRGDDYDQTDLERTKEFLDTVRYYIDTADGSLAKLDWHGFHLAMTAARDFIDAELLI